MGCGAVIAHRPSSKAYWLETATANGADLASAPPRIRGDRDVVLAGVSADSATPFDLQLASNNLKADRGVVHAAVRRRGAALQHASPELQADREVVLSAVRENGYALKYASAALRDDREIVLAALHKQAHAQRVLLLASPAMQCDRDVVLATMKLNGRNFCDVPEQFEEDKEVVMAAVQSSHWLPLRQVPDCFLGDREVVAASIQNVPEYLRDAAEELRHSPEMLAAVRPYWLDRARRWPHSLAEAPEEFSEDEEFMELVRSSWQPRLSRESGSPRSGLQSAPPCVRSDRAMVRSALEQDPRDLCFAAGPLREDLELTMLAVSLDGEALRFASPTHRASREVVQEAVGTSGKAALKYACSELQEDNELLRLASVRKDPVEEIGGDPKFSVVSCEA